MSIDQLHQAVADLTQPRRIRIARDNGQAEYATTPSLWHQLQDATATGREGPATHNKWILPIDPDTLDLRHEIQEVVADALASHDRQPRQDLPASLRLLAHTIARVQDDDLTEWWTYRIRSWTNRATHLLGINEQPMPRRIRDTACPQCQATHVAEHIDGEERYLPALVIDFDGQLVRAASCESCGHAWFRGEQLHQLADLIAG